MQTVVSPEKIESEKATKSNNSSWQPGVQLFLRLSGWIGGPVLIGAAAGSYLDTTYHTDPWLFLFSIGIAFFVSMWALIHYGIKEIKRIESEFPAKESQQNKSNDTPWQNN